MIHSKKIVLGLLVSSLSFQAFPMEQEAIAPEVEVTQEEIVTEPAPTMAKAYAIRTIDFASKKLGHIKKCLQGKEACSKTDFAMLAASLLFLRQFFYSLAVQTELKIPTSKYQFRKHSGIPGIVTTPALKVDPTTYGHRAGRWIGTKLKPYTKKVTDPIEEGIRSLYR